MRQSMRATRKGALVLIFTSVTLLALIYSGRSVESKVPRARASTKPTSATAPQTQDPSVVGQWGPVQILTVPDDPQTPVDETRVTPIHINLLPNGRLLLWGRDRDVFGLDTSGASNTYVLDPFYMSLTSVRNYRTNLFCSGHSFLPDGRLIVTGGHDTVADRLREGIGSIHTNIFDYKTNKWEGNPIPGASPQPTPPNMNNGRWYPYNLTLGNGETLVLSGSFLDTTQDRTTQNDIPQIRDANGVWRNVKGVRQTFNGAALANYPYVHLLPIGWAYVAGSESQQDTYALIPSAINGEGLWFRGRSPRFPHFAGGSVQYEAGKLINIGGVSGGTGSLKNTEIVNLSEGNPTLIPWTDGPDMTFGRNNHTSTLLPDGKVLVTGGSTCPGFSNLNCGPTGPANAPELWTPGGGWQTLASHQIPRVYHSTAILLPDGRVMAGGGGLPAHPGESPATGVVCGQGELRAVCRNFSHNDVEIFSPPYLFMPGGGAAPRPTIRYAPKEVTYGQSFDINVGTVTAQDVADVVLVRLGAVTHGYNQDQRRVRLNINSRSEDGLTINVSAPVDGNACPPGHYMLFLMKQNGVDKMTPSIAKIIRVSKATTPDTLLAFPATFGLNSTGSRTLTVNGPDIWTAEVTKGNFLSVSKLGNQITITVQANWSTPTTPSERREGQVTIKVTGQPVFNHVIDVYQGKEFTDVSSPVIHEAASKLSAVQVVAGCAPGQYCPGLNVTREEMAVLLIRSVLGGSEDPPAVNRQTFEDVPVGHWSHKYVEDLFTRNMTTGCNVNPRRFCPTNPVSRAELAVFILRVLNITPPQPSGPTYSDSQQSWAYFFIEEATRQKLMGGCATTGAFCPNDPVTRAEAAETLVRVLKL